MVSGIGQAVVVRMTACGVPYGLYYEVEIRCLRMWIPTAQVDVDMTETHAEWNRIRTRKKTELVWHCSACAASATGWT